MQRFLGVSHGCMPSVPPNSPLIKWREAFLVLFLDLGISIDPSVEIFLPTPLVVSLTLILISYLQDVHLLRRDLLLQIRKLH